MAGSNFIVRGGADFSAINKALTQTQTKLNTFSKNSSRSLNKGFTKAQSAFSDFKSGASKALKAVGAAVSAFAIGKLVKDSTALAMSVESAMGNIQRSMGTASKAFENWVNTQSKSLGMARADAYKYGSTFSNLLSSFIGGAEETATQTQELMKAASVISSKTGRSFEDVSERIRSGLLGSTEAIEDLGVYVNVSMLESTKAFKKFANGKSWNQLTYQTQQQIRLAAILEQTYERYGDTLANTTATKQQKFLATLQNIRLNLGQAFLPIYNTILPALNAMASKIEEITSRISASMQVIFGKVGETKSIQKQSQAVTALGDAAEESGKKIKKSLAGIDEINILSQNENPQGAVSLNGVGANVTTSELNSLPEPEIPWLESFKSKFDKFKQLFDFSGIKKSLENLKTALSPISEKIGEGLVWLIDNVLTPLSAWTVNELVPAFLNALAGALTVLDSVLTTLEPLGQWLWESFLQPIATWTGGAIVDILKGIGNALTVIGDWISNNKALVETMAIVVGSFAAAWGLVNAAINLWNIIGVIAAGVTGAFGAALAFLTSPIGIVTVAIGALIAIVVLLVKNWDKVKETAAKVWDGIRNIWNSASNWIDTKVVQPIGKLFSNLWDGIKNGFIGFINFIIKGINKIIEGFLMPINTLIKGWNSTVGKVAGTIPEIKISIPEIPKFAQGGIAYGPSLVQVAEYSGARSNPEVIAPLDKLRDMIANISGGDINLTANILLDDGTIVGRTTQRITRQSRLTGASALGV